MYWSTGGELGYKVKTFTAKAGTGTLQRKKSMCSEEASALGLLVMLTGTNREQGWSWESAGVHRQIWPNRKIG